MKHSRFLAFALVVVFCAILFFFAWWRGMLTPTALPTSIPQDFSVTWISGGGMSPDSEMFSLAGVRGAWEINAFADGRQKKQTGTFTITEQQLQDVYTFLRENRADKIREGKEEIYDGGNDGYRLSWEDQVMSTPSLLVDPVDEARYEKIYSFLGDFLQRAAHGDE